MSLDRFFYTPSMQMTHRESAQPRVRGVLGVLAVCATLTAVLLLSACAATPAGDPLQSLDRTDLTPARQVAAMRVQLLFYCCCEIKFENSGFSW